MEVVVDDTILLLIALKHFLILLNDPSDPLSCLMEGVESFGAFSVLKERLGVLGVAILLEGRSGEPGCFSHVRTFFLNLINEGSLTGWLLL